MERAAHGPLQPGDVREVRVAGAWREDREKVGEALPVLEETRAGRRIRPDVAVRREAEEAPVHEPADDGEGRFEDLRQAREDVVPVDLDPRGRREAVGQDQAFDVPRALVEDRRREGGLELRQRSHRASSP